jgi:hypothetical protein
MLVLVSAVILGSKSRGTRDHILLSEIRDSLNLEGQVPVCTGCGISQLTAEHFVGGHILGN